MATRSIPLSAIRVGKRHRKDLGDIRSLARSIQEIGLLHPVVIRPDGKLIAGERRLRALKLLGWTKVPVTVLDLDKVIHGEVAETSFARTFAPRKWSPSPEPLSRYSGGKPRPGRGRERTCGKISRMSMVAGPGTNSENMLVFSVHARKDDGHRRGGREASAKIRSSEGRNGPKGKDQSHLSCPSAPQGRGTHSQTSSGCGEIPDAHHRPALEI